MWPAILQLWWSAAIVLGVAGIAVGVGDTPSVSPPRGGSTSEMLLWLLAAACVVVTLISHRPDADDAFYVNVAVAMVDAPGRALLSKDTMHGVSGLPLPLPVYRVHSYELLNGALAYLTGIPAIYSFHWLSAAFAALLVPLAHARSSGSSPRSRWLATVATLVFILIAAGETHRWYGNFAFVRMWQGKAIFLVVFMPLVYAYALRFAVRPNAARLDDAGGGADRRRRLQLVGTVGGAARRGHGPVLRRAAIAPRAGDGRARHARVGLRTRRRLVRPRLARRHTMGGWLSRDAAASELRPWSLQFALVTVLGDRRLLIFAIFALLTAWVVLPRRASAGASPSSPLWPCCSDC